MVAALEQDVEGAAEAATAGLGLGYFVQSNVSIFGCGPALVEDLEHYGLSLESRRQRMQAPRECESHVSARGTTFRRLRQPGQ